MGRAAVRPQRDPGPARLLIGLAVVGLPRGVVGRGLISGILRCYTTTCPRKSRKEEQGTAEFGAHSEEDHSVAPVPYPAGRTLFISPAGSARKGGGPCDGL